jgi:hypothetical protein
MLGLYHAQPGGRRFRQLLSDARRLRDGDASLLLEALAAVDGDAPLAMEDCVPGAIASVVDD